MSEKSHRKNKRKVEISLITAYVKGYFKDKNIKSN